MREGRSSASTSNGPARISTVSVWRRTSGVSMMSRSLASPGAIVQAVIVLSPPGRQPEQAPPSDLGGLFDPPFEFPALEGTPQQPGACITALEQQVTESGPFERPDRGTAQVFPLAGKTLGLAQPRPASARCEAFDCQAYAARVRM